MKLTHNNRTAEYSYKAKPQVAVRVTSLIRDIYGKQGYKITSESVDGDTHLVALTNMKWKPVPKYVQNDVPILVRGVLLGYDLGFLDGMVQTSARLGQLSGDEG